MRLDFQSLLLMVLSLLMTACSLKDSEPLGLLPQAPAQPSEAQNTPRQWTGSVIEAHLLNFSNVKEQVLVPKCLKCHKSYAEFKNVYDLKDKIYQRAITKQDMPSKKSGLLLTDYEGALLKQWIESGAAIEAGAVVPPAELPEPGLSGLERPVVWETIKIKILDKHCISCHFKGNPDGISSYEDYKTVKKTIATIYGLSAIKPVMPPPPEDFLEGDVNPNQLSTQEKDLLAAWINDGLLEKK